MSAATVASFVRLERVTRVAALGLRFFDPARQRVVPDLRVTAHWPGTGRRPRPMRAGPSGIFVLHSAGPGWPDVEAAAVDDTFWDNLPPPRDVLVAVADPAGRFLPFTLSVPVPPPGARPGGLFVPDCLLSSPAAMPPPAAGDLDAVPLFRAPAAPTPQGMAVLRADLWDVAAGAPAAGAVLDVFYDSLLISRGIADERGAVLALMPYPDPVDFNASSPGTGTSPWLQAWDLEIAVAARPDLALWRPLPGVLPASQPFMDLCGAWDQLRQPLATVWSSRSPDQPLSSTILRAGEDLLLSTVVGGQPSSRLLLTPAP